MEDVNKVIEALQKHAEYGLTLTELITISGLAHSDVINVFEVLENTGKLFVKSDGLSRIYKLRE